MENVHVIVNPFSARGKTGARWGDIKEVIKHYFKEYNYIFTEKPKQATELAREVIKEGADLVIGVGGDGTLNEITNGFFKHDSHEAVNSDASISIIPSGTGSDFIRYLKISKDFHRSVKQIKDASNRRFDVGRVTFHDAGRSNYFINVADFGLGAEVVKLLTSVPGGKPSSLAYYKGLLTAVRTYKSRNIRIVLDDKVEICGRYLIGAIANGRIFGGGMIIAAQAEPDDGLFDLVLIDQMKKFEIIRNSRHLYSGKLKTHPKVSTIQAKNIKVYSLEEEQVNIEYDGEMGLCTPAEFSIMPKSLNFRI